MIEAANWHYVSKQKKKIASLAQLLNSFVVLFENSMCIYIFFK